ncbi:hypothetical protein KP509_03G055600 [Ceratopteris richardii]|uniref:Peptidase S9 prolyl oligopeptidase catalytic domain-containing protein n=1 Tax=Ceratopteris richardii TaxID=49495 RepID=A0A8T2V7E9_CERRI|nr:hypothetical protein KP509_03G055600 [Ceratopteris richardii]
MVQLRYYNVAATSVLISVLFTKKICLPSFYRPAFAARCSYSTMKMSTTKKEAAFGSWASPLTADLVASSGKKLGGISVSGHGSFILLEGRPTESGRGVLVQHIDGPNDVFKDITPSEFNVRTLVHEYGGGAFTIDGDDVIFSNYKDQRLYLQSLTSGGQPIPLTPDYGGNEVRYADGVVDRRLNRFITVREDNRLKNKEPVNEIVAVELSGDNIKEPEVLVTGNDFYSFPRLNTDASRIAWIEWSHPCLPWDKSELWIGDLSSEGKILKKSCVAGKSGVIESPTEPKWSSKGDLFYISDRETGFWNLYCWDAKKDCSSAILPMEAEFSRPAWGFGNSSYEILDDCTILCSYRNKGKSNIGILDLMSHSFKQLRLPFTEIFDLLVRDNWLFVEVASPSQPLSVAKVNLGSIDSMNLDYTVLWSSNSLKLSEYSPYLSTPDIIEFPTERSGQTAFANFYPPHNDDYCAPAAEKPPLLVRCHGGPTAEARTSLNLSIQFWTSRGWAVADVNYGGSTGYGREYRERLYGAWGIVDVDDCCSCAKFLVRYPIIDSLRTPFWYGCWYIMMFYIFKFVFYGYGHATLVLPSFMF